MTERTPIHAREELNALRTILFTPKLGTKIVMSEEMTLRLAGHLNRLQEWCERAHAEIREGRADG